MPEPTAPRGLDTAGDAFVVQLRVPPEPRSVRPVRAAVASVGVDLGFDLDELDDLRVAVQEALGLALARTTEAVEIAVAEDDGRVAVTISITTDEAPAEPSNLARQLLDVLVAEHRVEPVDGGQRIHLRSHPPEDRAGAEA